MWLGQTWYLLICERRAPDRVRKGRSLGFRDKGRQIGGVKGRRGREGEAALLQVRDARRGSWRKVWKPREGLSPLPPKCGSPDCPGLNVALRKQGL